MSNKLIKLDTIINSEDLIGINTNHYQQAIKLKKALLANTDTPWRIHIGHYYFNNENTVFLNNGEAVSIEYCLIQNIPFYQLMEVDMTGYLSPNDIAMLDTMHANRLNRAEKTTQQAIKTAEKQEKREAIWEKVATCNKNSKSL